MRLYPSIIREGKPQVPKSGPGAPASPPRLELSRWSAENFYLDSGRAATLECSLRNTFSLARFEGSFETVLEDGVFIAKKLVSDRLTEIKGDKLSTSKPVNRTLLNRREALLFSASAGMSLLLDKPGHALDSTKTAAHQEPGNCTTPSTAVAKTQYGKVRGFVDGGVYTFKGIPYGQDTGGDNRWLPAKAPNPWTGEYPALIYGANCPQNLHNYKAIEQSFLQDWDDGYMSEDMLKLNIWTPSLTGKRAVMVYFHGGGFSFGSSYELPSQEGAQMARHHDVVQISVNHRLNVLGFFRRFRDWRFGLCRFSQRRND